MQKRIFILSLLAVVIVSHIHGQSKRFDTSMKVGKVGFRVLCGNKSADKNTVTISPIGFESGAREISFEIKGKINKAEADDLNNDGFPDMVLYVYSGGLKNIGTVVGVSSDNNKGFAPIFFPDIKDDQKLMVGYGGNDEFTLMEGSLLRRFPLYVTTDTANITATGMMRQVLYRVTTTEKGAQKFTVTRSYEIKKQ
jgi:hypothetical protein